LAGSVPSLWLDVFQKIKALGFSGVSFYVDWALLEGKQGNFTAEGVFAFEPFAAASKAGVYLVAVSQIPDDVLHGSL
jgi:beta-galactosidase GanA